MSAKLFWRFPSDAGTVTAISAATNYPATNVQLPHANSAEAWKSDGNQATERLVFDLGAAYTVSAFCALAHDIPQASTGVKVMGNSSNSWASPAFTQAVTWREDKLVEFFAEQTYRWWAFEFTKPSAGTIATIGRLLIGPAYDFPQNVSARSVEWGSDEETKTERTKSGASFSDVAAHLDAMRFKVEFIGQDQKDELDALNRTFGLHSPFVFTLDHTLLGLKGFVYGKQTAKVSFRDRTWNTAVKYDAELKMVEEK